MLIQMLAISCSRTFIPKLMLDLSSLLKYYLIQAAQMRLQLNLGIKLIQQAFLGVFRKFCLHLKLLLLYWQ